MDLSYYFSFRAPADAPATRLAAFLKNVEGDAKFMDFDPPVVVDGPFDAGSPGIRAAGGARAAR